jgi:hypothetical protein
LEDFPEGDAHSFGNGCEIAHNRHTTIINDGKAIEIEATNRQYRETATKIFMS